MTNKANQLALLGTSADPPTHGHQVLLEGLAKLFPMVITWASDNPFKTHNVCLSQRQELLKILVTDLNLPNLEVNHNLSSPWALQTIEKAELYWPDSELILIIGSDLIDQIPTWLRSKDLLKKARLGIAPRDGWPIKKLALKTITDLGGKIDLLPLNIPPAASSSIRNKPKIVDIPKAILPTLVQKNLYGLATTTK